MITNDTFFVTFTTTGEGVAGGEWGDIRPYTYTYKYYYYYGLNFPNYNYPTTELSRRPVTLLPRPAAPASLGGWGWGFSPPRQDQTLVRLWSTVSLGWEGGLLNDD